MSELISPIHAQDTTPESVQARLREIAASRQTDLRSSPAVTMQMRPIPKALDDAQAAATVNQVQAEMQRGADAVSAHSGLDPQRVAKLLGLRD